MVFLKDNIAFWNGGGGVRSKYDYLKHLLIDRKLSVIFISESEISENDLDILKISDYDLLTASTLGDGSNAKSRVCCYVHSSIRYKQLKIGAILDVIAIEIENYRIIGLYRPFKLPPNTNRVSFFHSIIDCLTGLSKTDKELIIGGDFNIDLGKKSANLDYLQKWAIDYGLQQLVTNFTWRRVILGEVKTSAIDHVYTNDPKISVNQIQSVSDHDIILVSKEFPRIERRKVVQRDWRSYSSDKLNEELSKELEKMSINQNSFDYASLVSLFNNILDRLAPKRSIRIREAQIVSQKLEKLKKRRDRKFKKFRKGKNKDAELLKDIKKLNKDIRLCIRDETARTFQNKAMSKDPKIFWQAVNTSLGKSKGGQISIEDNGKIIEDQFVLSEMFGSFFLDKVKKYSHLESRVINIPIPQKPIEFSTEEILRAVKEFKRKKCSGIDNVPQIMLKDASDCMLEILKRLFDQFAASGLPVDLKVARVQPLHKKGSRNEISNYRPISNLSPFSKLFERCVLERLNQELPVADGHHQHGFKKCHSTETAMLTLQSFIAESLDNKKASILYSVDLSAAFDLLIPDKFYQLYKDSISEGLMFTIMDFLQERKFRVDMSENCLGKTVHSLDRGCVQGSVLGPRLFSLYVGGLERELVKHCDDIKVVSFADDTYVLVTSNDWKDLPLKVETVLSAHVSYLKELGMTVNESKTELMAVGDKPQNLNSIFVNNIECKLSDNIKVLGVTFDSKLTWDTHSEKAILKGKGLISAFRHVRKYLTESQFLKSVTCNFYSSVYYGASVWLSNCKAISKTKLTSLHFRLLRTACKDYGYKLSRVELTNRCLRATPLEWSRYTTASVAIKTIRDKQPMVLHDILKRTYYAERRNIAKGLFYDSSRTKMGRQSLQNRLPHVKHLKVPWNELDSKLSNHSLRIMLKETYFGCHAQQRTL
jgi:hypothetical protein